MIIVKDFKKKELILLFIFKRKHFYKKTLKTKKIKQN